MLAMKDQTTRASRQPALSFTPIASLLAPTVHLSRQPHPSKQLDIKVRLSFLLLYPAQAFFKARIYQIYQQT
jgi:hypothetical protein